MKLAVQDVEPLSMDSFPISPSLPLVIAILMYLRFWNDGKLIRLISQQTMFPLNLQNIDTNIVILCVAYIVP